MLPWLAAKLTTAPPGSRLLERVLTPFLVVVLVILLLQMMRNKVTPRIRASMQMEMKLAIIEQLLSREHERCSPRSTGDAVFLLTAASDAVDSLMWFIHDYAIPSAISTLAVTWSIMRYDGLLALGYLGVSALLMTVLMVTPMVCGCHAAASTRS